MKQYSVVQVGLGLRGITHLKAFSHFPDRIRISGVCDILPDRVSDVGDMFSVPESARYTDAEAMVRDLRPDILSFCTLPDVRLSMIEIAVRYGVSAVCFEKPMATSLADAGKITQLCEENNIKAVVCQQHKYFRNYEIIGKILEAGEIGKISRINAECNPWLSQLGTHYMDYIMWANGYHEIVSVAGHVHGRSLLGDSHPSPDYFLGEGVFDNGVRTSIQCGYFSRKFTEHSADYQSGEFPLDFWEDDRLTVYGETGYVWAECSGRWGAFTPNTGGKAVGGKEPGFRDELENPYGQIRYTEELLDWLDGAIADHKSNVMHAYKGYEALEAMCVSALEMRRVDLPLDVSTHYNVFARMEEVLPEVPRRELPRGF